MGGKFYDAQQAAEHGLRSATPVRLVTLYEKIMTEHITYICTDCLFTGKPCLSVGRLVIELVVNFFICDPIGTQIYQRVRHCPECGSHAMVSIESEAGQKALSELKEKGSDKKDDEARGH